MAPDAYNARMASLGWTDFCENCAANRCDCFGNEMGCCKHCSGECSEPHDGFCWEDGCHDGGIGSIFAHGHRQLSKAGKHAGKAFVDAIRSYY